MNVVVASAIPTLTVGNRVFTDLTNLIILYGAAHGTTTTNCTFRKANASSGYTPSGSKAFKVQALSSNLSFSAASTNGTAVLLYSDSDTNPDTSNVFTNPVYIGGNASNAAIGNLISLSNSHFEYAVDFTIPNLKYPGFSISSTSTVFQTIQLYGYEV
jgi:hypothetical protein